MRRRINMHSQPQMAVKKNRDSDEERTPPFSPPRHQSKIQQEVPMSHSRNRQRGTIQEIETGSVQYNQRPTTQKQRANHLKQQKKSVYEDYLKDLKKRTSRVQIKDQNPNKSRVILKNSISKNSLQNRGNSGLDYNANIQVRYESSKSDDDWTHEKRDKNSAKDIFINSRKLGSKQVVDTQGLNFNMLARNPNQSSNKVNLQRPGPQDLNNLSPSPASSSITREIQMDLKEGSQASQTDNRQMPNLSKDALMSLGNSFQAQEREIGRHDRNGSQESDSEFRVSSERSIKKGSIERLPVTSYVSPIVTERMRELNGTFSSEQQSSSGQQQKPIRINDQHARMKKDGPSSTFRSNDGMNQGSNQASFQRQSVVLRHNKGYQVLSPQRKTIGAKYTYDYGYQQNNKSPKAIIQVEPGQNLYRLGGKLQKEEFNVIPPRTTSQLKQNDEVVSISDIISQTSSPQPLPQKKYSEKKAKLFNRSERGEKIFQAGHQNFDPIEYMKEHHIVCQKFNYSVPQSYDDLPCVLSVSKDAKFIHVYNIEGMENNDNMQKLTNPMNKIEISKITGFIYGGSGTRFWMLRLGINQRIADNLVEKEISPGVVRTGLRDGFELPFYAWECISIHTQEREIDLVIQNEYQMKAFIQFLIIRLDSMNGQPGSVQVLKDNGILRKNVPTMKMLPRIYNSFFLMKIRMKISFEACTQSKTITELYLFSILKTYQERNQKGLIADPWPKIGKKHIAHLREASMKDIAEKGKLDQEAQIRQHIRMERPEVQQSGVPVSPENNQDKSKDMKMLGMLAGAVLKKDGIDELFGDHLESDEEDAQQYDLTTAAVKDLKQAEKEQMERKLMTEEEKEKDQTQRQRKRFLFKKRMALQDTKTLYNRTLMIIRLRIMQGPMFVYALLQAMQLCKQTLALQLEQGRECVIPEQLGQKHLPLSFQYYDSILEITRQHISKDQKRFILKLNFDGSKIKMKQAKQVPVSLQQRLSRYIKKNWKKLAKYQCNEHFEHNLNLYQKSQSVQTARYLQIDKANLRVKHEIGADEEMILEKLEKEIDRRMSAQSSPGSRNVGQNQKHGSFSLCKSQSQMTSGLVGINALRKSDTYGSHLPDHQRVQIDFNYITHQGVGRKRRELFKKKIFYQNQLMTLKEKGRRLLICNKIEQQSLSVIVGIIEREHMAAHGHTHKEAQRCDDDKFNNAKSMLGASNAIRDQTITSNSIKQQLDAVMRKISEFETKTREYQEGNVVQMRRKFIRDLKRIIPFNEKNQMIDKKIEYDQRFFNDGYAEFQLMISDIRKQVRLNEEILMLRKELENVYDDMVTNEEKTYKDEIKKFKGNLKKQIIQTQFTNKMKEMKVLQDEAEENQRIVTKLIEHKKYQVKKQKQSNETTPAVSEAGKQMQKDGEFYDNFILESDAEQEEDSNSKKKYDQTLQKTQREIQDRNVVRQKKKQPNIESSKKRDRALSNISDVDRMHWQGKDEEQSPDRENAYEQLLKKMKQGSPPSKHRSQALQHGQQIKEDSDRQNSRSASLKKIRSQSHGIKNILAEFVKRKMSATDESEHKTISKAETIQRKIMKRRSKIKQVSQHSQKSLWGKGGGYEPYDIGKAKEDPKYRSLVSHNQTQRSVSQTIANQSENNSVQKR